MKELFILVMSVGKFEDNGSVKYLLSIKTPLQNIIVCLPKEKKENAESYKQKGVQVYLYDEKKYINDEFEFFGFRRRNCGGIGRQGIAEATEKFSKDDNILLQIDDDTSNISVVNKQKKSTKIRDYLSLMKIFNVCDNFFLETGIYAMGRNGAQIPDKKFFTTKKVFNNFIMRKGIKENFDGFKSLCSDDQRFNFYYSLRNAIPMRSFKFFVILFTQNQGDRKDGNAPLYNGDYSWKKSYSLKMMFPWATHQIFKKEENRYLFRENMEVTDMHPKILLVDKMNKLYKIE